MDSLLKKILGIPRWADPITLRNKTGILSLEEIALKANYRISMKQNNNYKNEKEKKNIKVLTLKQQEAKLRI